MRVLGLALAAAMAISLPIAAHADGAGRGRGSATAGPMPGIGLTGAGPAMDTFAAIGGGRPAAGQSHRGRVSPLGRGSPFAPAWIPFGGPGVPAYWVWGPSGGGFDYPFADWRGPTGGWGNP